MLTHGGSGSILWLLELNRMLSMRTTSNSICAPRAADASTSIDAASPICASAC
jgi:hypothetical protein